ncbi:methyltransferase domain-containing protein [Endozoicomonas sp. ALC020]|uniref:methyltransferase domain-containing protein n=1 Tax=unclassified Endozoicomonas TaxID=2644528 RepID=UPI003BAF25A7
MFFQKKNRNYNSVLEIENLANQILSLTNKKSQPNTNKLNELLRDVNLLKWNTKTFGYELGKFLEPNLKSIEMHGEPRKHNLTSKLTTQTDVESTWFKYWCNELKIAPFYHRKLWEFAFVLQALFEHEVLLSGNKCMGFGCGAEPLVSYFASKNLFVMATDLDERSSKKKGWISTNQYLSNKEQGFKEELVDIDLYNKNVEYNNVDMNDIPDSFTGYDFCWSICALEHLGSINNGLEFIKNSLNVLKPGGIAIHTTEYNYTSDHETIDNWPTVLFRKCDMKKLSKDLSKHKHHLYDIDFSIGDMILDKFIDIPPYSSKAYSSIKQTAHLKLTIDGFPCTCIGIIVKKSEL